MKTLIKLMLASLLLLPACGDDDGGEVREIGGTATGSGSGSASASGTGSASASGSGSATGAAGECVTEGTTSEEASVEVTVALDEFTVEPSPAEADAGAIAFVADNAGAEPHELVIVRADDADELPVDDDGAMAEEELEEGALIGEIEEFAAGGTCEAAFELDAGDYVLLCNLVEEHDGELEAHFAEGMYEKFSVR